MRDGAPPTKQETGEQRSGPWSAPWRRISSDPWCQAAALLWVCGVILLPRLGTWGFSYTEGHRVIPAWEMMESGDYLVPRMFGRIYLRKPPGLSWLIAASSTLLGQTELAARLVSAVAAALMSLVAFVFANRWFGRPWGFAAGLAQILTPLFWGHARAVEIESLNHLATQVSVLCLLDLLVLPARRTGAGVRTLICLTVLSLCVMGLAKGPAGAPCVLGAVIAACVVARSARPLFRPALWASIAFAAALLILVGLACSAAISATGEPALTQGVSAFLWDTSRWSATVLLGPITLAWGLPTTLALLFPFFSESQTGGSNDADRNARALAQSVALASLISLAIYTASGVHNPRYAVPAVSFVPILVAYVVRGSATCFRPAARKLGRFLLLRSPVVWPILLSIGAAVWIFQLEPHRGYSSGREPAVRLGRLLPDGAEVWADGIIEARPELLLYLRRAAAEEGKRVRVRWQPKTSGHLPIPSAGNYLLLLRGTELGRYRDAGLLDHLEPVSIGRVHKYDFVLLRATMPPGRQYRSNPASGSPIQLAEPGRHRPIRRY